MANCYVIPFVVTLLLQDARLTNTIIICLHFEPILDSHLFLNGTAMADITETPVSRRLSSVKNIIIVLSGKG